MEDSELRRSRSLLGLPPVILEPRFRSQRWWKKPVSCPFREVSNSKPNVTTKWWVSPCRGWIWQKKSNNCHRMMIPVKFFFVEKTIFFSLMKCFYCCVRRENFLCIFRLGPQDILTENTSIRVSSRERAKITFW